MSLTIIPGVVSNQTIRALKPSDSAHAAAIAMAEHDISAMLVVDDEGRLLGIVTERDLARRIVARNALATQVSLEEIMTGEVKTVAPAALALEALETMRRFRFRHLPVVEEGRVVGMVSMRDLRQSIAEFSADLPKRPVRRWLRKLPF